MKTSVASTFVLGVLAMMVAMPPICQAQSPAPAPGLVAATPTLSAQIPVTAEEAFALLDLEKPVTPEQLEACRALLDEACKADPKSAKFTLGRMYVSRAKRERPQAKQLAQLASKLDPTMADAWYWKGATIFENIFEASMLDQVGMAGDARDALLKAIELDPNHLDARTAVAQFYIEAPGIAGGSLRKAREQGNAILKIKGGKSRGHLVLAGVAAEDDEWKDAAAEFELASAAATTDDERWDVTAQHAGLLMNKKEDPGAVIAMLTPHVAAISPSQPPAISNDRETFLRFLLAEALRKEKRWSDAQAQYELVVAINPQAKTSRFALGECFEKQKKYAQAATWYTQFAEKFPDDARASDAKDRAKSCLAKIP